MNEILRELKRLINSIPEGKITTFDILSDFLGSKYAVKFIVQNYKKLKAPWWRVVRSDGYIKDHIQEKILKKEGIVIENHKIKDVDKYIFRDFDIKDKILEKYRKIQEELSKKILLEDRFYKLEIFGGVDISYKKEHAIVVFVILDKDLNIINKYIFKTNVEFPYIPSFLSFREGEPIIKTFNQINENIDVLFVNGHGILHPIKMGLATYIGVTLDIPTIGITKKLLKIENMKIENNYIFVNNERVGYKLVKFNDFVYVSPGNLISLDSSIAISEKFWIMGKYPEPIRLADEISKKLKKFIL